MLIIISVLIVAAIIFATVYLSNLKNKTSGQEEMSKISEGFVSDSNQYIIPITSFYLSSKKYRNFINIQSFIN